MFLNTYWLLRHALKNQAISIGIVIVVLLVGAGIIALFLGASLIVVASLILGLIWGRIIPWVLSWGFKDKAMLINRLYKFFHLKHVRLVGFPDSLEGGIMYYKTRPKLPLKEFLSRIDQRMDMLALSFTVIVQNIDSIKSVIASGKHITFLMLNPDSRFVDIHTHLYSDATNLRAQIETSLGALWQLRNEYPDRVTIMTYNDLAPLAITIIDNEIIKVEDRLVGRDSNSRPSHLGYRTSTPDFFDRYQREYNRILNLASDYRPI